MQSGHLEDAVLGAFDGGVPEYLILRVDNGPQYISQQSRSSMNLLRISLEYIQKHTPEDNGNIESFHSSLKRTTSGPTNSREASVAIESAFTDYNKKRPHSSVDYLPSRVFRRKFQNDQSFREGYTRKLEVK